MRQFLFFFFLAHFAVPAVAQQKDIQLSDVVVTTRCFSMRDYKRQTPLVIIDGVISKNEKLQALNPSEIEQVSVLKGSAATAIYGAQGGAGVILVTTKAKAAGQAKAVERAERLLSEMPPEKAGTHVFPNPAHDRIQARFVLDNEQEVAIAIYNLQGKLIGELFNGILPAGVHEQAFQLPTMPQGAYLLKIVGTTMSASEPIIIH